MNPEITEKYGDRVRVRACGLCWKDDKLLLVNHKSLAPGNFWAAPGGGLNFGETALEAVVREFKEETNITVRTGNFQFACEFIQSPLHAIELFFEVIYESGTVAQGIDPESIREKQIIAQVKYLSMDEILFLQPYERHGIFRFIKTAAGLKDLTGFYRI